MGGLGSGRPGWKRKTNHLRSIDANRMYKAGQLHPGHWGGWKWSENGEKTASINTQADFSRLTLKYRVRPYGEDWEDIVEPIALDWIESHHGGKRPYFLCLASVNGHACGRRVVKLYLGGRYFLCRQCQRLAYSSQSETQMQRAMRKANKIRTFLSKDRDAGIWEVKPKGMHRKTYLRHVEAMEAADAEADSAFFAMFQRRFPGMRL